MFSTKSTIIIIKIFCFFTLFSTSCKDSCNKRNEFFITNGDFKYWDVIQDSIYNIFIKDQSIPTLVRYFDKEGRYWKYYNVYKQYGNKTLIKREKISIDDVVLSDKWRLKTDTSFYLNGEEYFIVKLNIDTFIYSNSTVGKVIMIKSKFQLLE